MTESVKPQSRFYQLDGLRGVAALTVLIDHARAIPLETVSPIPTLFSGDLTVILFYLLSGFVLSRPWVGDRERSYGHYIVRRFTRLYLPYFTAVVVTLALATVMQHDPLEDCSPWFNQFWIEPVTANIIVHHLFMTNIHNTFDPPLWSLVFETRIAIVFPFMMYALRNNRMRNYLMLCGFLVLVWGAARFAPLPAPFIVQTKELCIYAGVFVLGSAISLNLDRVRQLPLNPILLIALGLALCQDGFNIPWTPMRFVMAACASAILIGVLKGGLVARALATPVPVWLGRVSYSLYLVHVPVLIACVRILDFVPLPVSIAIGVVASLVVAEVFNHLVERPSQFAGRYFAPSPSAPRSLAATHPTAA